MSKSSPKKPTVASGVKGSSTAATKPSTTAKTVSAKSASTPKLNGSTSAGTSKPISAKAISTSKPNGAKAISTTRPTGNGVRAVTAPVQKTPSIKTTDVDEKLEAQSVKGRVALSPRPAALSRAQQRRKDEKRKEFFKRWGPVGAVAGVVVVGILIFVLLSNTGGTPAGVGQPVPASVLKDITTVQPTVYNTVKTGGLTDPLQVISGKLAILKTSAGLPRFVYIGAEFCPYCAAERWSMILALSRFGTFSNLELMASSSGDIYPNTSTFTFVNSTYTSKYLSFEAVETEDRNSNALQTPNSDQNQLFSTYDAPPYTTSSGGIPFIDIGNQYVEISSAYIPANLSGLTWQQIAGYLTNPQSAITQEMIGGANYLTAGICASTGNTPAAVCTTGAIPAIEQQIAKGA